MSPAPHTCPTCSGKKTNPDGGPCPTCDATGVVWSDAGSPQEAAVTSPTELDGL